MEKLTPLIEQLAAKVGIAAQILWTALQKQAVLSSCWDVVLYAALAYGIVWYVRWGKAVQLHTSAKYDNSQRIERWDDIAWLPFCLAGIPILIFALIAICNVPMTLAGFFNPDYWALKHIVH